MSLNLPDVLQKSTKFLIMWDVSKVNRLQFIIIISDENKYCKCTRKKITKCTEELK